MKKIFFLLLISFTIYAQKPINSDVLIPYRDKKLWGLSDTLGNIKVKPVYKEIKSFFIDKQNDEFVSRYVVKSNKYYYVINKDKKVFLPESNTYDSIHLNNYYPNHFWVFKKGKVGLYHKNKEIIPCLYDQIIRTENDSYIIKKGKFTGLINAFGKLIIPIEFSSIMPLFNEEIEEDTDDNEEIEPKNNNKFVWIAKTSKTEKKFYDTKAQIETTIYSNILEKRLGSETISGDSEDYDLIKNRLLETYDTVDIDQFENFAFVTKKNKKGVIDLKTNIEIINLIYDEVSYEGLNKNIKIFKTKRNDKFGLIKSGNQALLNCEFDDINEEHILTKDNRKGVFVFNTMYPYIKPKYITLKSIEPISISDYWQFGLFEVTTENGKGYVGENGVEYFND